MLPVIPLAEHADTCKAFIQSLDRSLTPVSNHVQSVINLQPIRYNTLWTTNRKRNEKALPSCSYLQKSIWLLWGGVTYTLAKYNCLPLRIQAWKFQVEESCNSFPAEGCRRMDCQQQGFSLLLLQDSDNCQYLLYMTTASKFSLSFCLKMERCWRNYSICSTSTNVLVLEELTVTRQYHTR